MVTVSVWIEEEGAFWDTSEDSGGFDRCSPMGPFQSIEAAQEDAHGIFDDIEFQDGKPDHYY